MADDASPSVRRNSAVLHPSPEEACIAALVRSATSPCMILKAFAKYGGVVEVHITRANALAASLFNIAELKEALSKNESLVDIDIAKVAALRTSRIPKVIENLLRDGVTNDVTDVIITPRGRLSLTIFPVPVNSFVVTVESTDDLEATAFSTCLLQQSPLLLLSIALKGLSIVSANAVGSSIISPAVSQGGIFCHDVFIGNDSFLFFKTIVREISSGMNWKGILGFKSTVTGHRTVMVVSAFPIALGGVPNSGIGMVCENVGDQVEKEQELKESKSQLTKMCSLLEGLDDMLALVISPVDSKVRYMNQAGARLCGFGANGELDSRYVEDIFTASDVFKVQKEIVQRLKIDRKDDRIWTGDLYFRNVETDEVIVTSARVFIINSTDSSDSTLLLGVVAKDMRAARAAATATRRRDSDRAKVVSILEKCDVLMSIVSLEDQRIVFLNRMGLTLLGISDSRLALSLSLADVAPVEDADRLHKALSRLQENETWGGRVNFINTQSGDIILLEISAFRIEVADDEERRADSMTRKTLVALVGHDIRSKKSSEQKIVYRELAISNMVEAMTVCDYSQRDYPLVYANKAFWEMTGFKESERLGHNLRFLQGTETDLRAVKMIGDRIRSGRDVSVEILNYKADGRAFWNQLSIKAVKNERGLVTHLVGVSRDITDKKQEMMEKLSLREGAIEASSEGIVVLSLTSALVQYYNNGFARITGYDKETAVGLPFYSFFTDGNGVEQATEAVERGDHYRTELSVMRTDGTVCWVRLVVAPLLSPIGIVLNTVCTLSDISDQRRAFQVIIEARDQAEEMAKAKSEFLSSMSHEIRTPLNAILGISYLVKQTTLSGKQAVLMDTVISSGQMLLGLVNDILDYSKMESSMMQLENRPIKIRNVVWSVSDVMASKALGTGVDLVIIIGPDVPEIVGADETRVKQVLINLIGNAFKFTEKGSVTVRVTAAKKHAEYILQFDVADTGIGMDPAKTDRLFERFTHADTSSTRKYGGTGLGLAICKMLIEAWGGKIWVTTAFGAGSTFHFSLPVHESQASFVGAATLDASLSHIKLLLIDDIRLNYDAFVAATSAWGVSVSYASGGEQGLAMLGESAYDVVFIDSSMGEGAGDGLDAAEEITKTFAENGKRAPPLVLVSVDQLIPENKEYSAFCTILLKPMKPLEIKEAILLAMDLQDNAAAPSLAPKLLKMPSMNATDNLLTEAAGLVIMFCGKKAAADPFESRGITLACICPSLDDVASAATKKPYDCYIVDMESNLDPIDVAATIKAACRQSFHPVGRVIGISFDADDDREECLQAGYSDMLALPLDPVALSAMFASMKRSKEEIAAANPAPLSPSSPCSSPSLRWLSPPVIIAFGVFALCSFSLLRNRLLKRT